MEIRKARVKDVASVLELWKELFLYHKKLPKNNKLKIYQKLKEGAENIFARWVKENIKSRNGVVFVAEDSDKIVGYCLIHIKPNVPVFKIKKLGYISDLYVKEDYRNKGVGSKFHKECFKWFRKKGLRHISLLVDAKNPAAHEFYKKHGFSDLYIEMRGEV